MCSLLPEILFCRGLSSANARKTLAIASLKTWGSLLACVRERSPNSHQGSRWGASSCPSCCRLAGHSAFSHTFPLTPHHLRGILPFLKQAFTEAPPAWRRGWAALCCGAGGAGGNRREPAGTGCARHRAAPGSPSPQTPAARKGVKRKLRTEGISQGPMERNSHHSKNDNSLLVFLDEKRYFFPARRSDFFSAIFWNLCDPSRSEQVEIEFLVKWVTAIFHSCP